MQCESFPPMLGEAREGAALLFVRNTEFHMATLHPLWSVQSGAKFHRSSTSRTVGGFVLRLLLGILFALSISEARAQSIWSGICSDFHHASSRSKDGEQRQWRSSDMCDRTRLHDDASFTITTTAVSPNVSIPITATQGHFTFSRPLYIHKPYTLLS